jgi:predicted metal-dependent hydrolase
MNLFSFSKLKKLFQPKILPLSPQGGHYDLKVIFNELNQAYFDNKLDLRITWFGSARRKAKRHRKLGLYCFRTKVVKIHRLLDQPHFPPYFISYVVYHEMLHSVCPPIKAKKGRYRIHHPHFVKREKEFAQYAEAKLWEKENRKLFFHISQEV